MRYKNNYFYFISRMLSTTVQRVDTHRRPHRIAGMRGECGIRQMATRSALLEVWEWAWARTAIAHVVTPVNLCTRRREKIETTSCPPLGISIPVRFFVYFEVYSNKIQKNKRTCYFNITQAE